MVAAIFWATIPDFPTPKITTFPLQVESNLTTLSTCCWSSLVAVAAIASDSNRRIRWTSSKFVLLVMRATVIYEPDLFGKWLRSAEGVTERFSRSLDSVQIDNHLPVSYIALS